MEYKCKWCSKIFKTCPANRRRGKGKFCSVKCSNKFHLRYGMGNKKPREIKNCQNCGKEFITYVCRKEIGLGKFCSRKCFDLYKRKRVFIKCLVCGKDKWYIQSYVNKGKEKGINRAKFCSKRCRAIYNFKNHRKFKDTSIELAIEDILQKNNIPYTKQAPIFGIALVDFLLPNKIIIQCDGDYWHNLKGRKERDFNQDFILNFKGYKIYRFTETEIRKSPIRCLNKIEEIK